MEDEEEASSQVNKSSLPEFEDSIVGDKLPGTEDPTTEQSHFVPDYVHESDDSKVVGADSPINVIDDVAVVADGKMETGEAIRGGGNYVSELCDFRIVGADHPIAVKDKKDDEAVAEEEIPTEDTKMDTLPKAKEVAVAEVEKGCGAKHFIELHDLQFAVSHSLIAAEDDGDDEAALGEGIHADGTKMEMEPKAEVEAGMAKGCEGELVPELHNSQLAAESLIAVKAYEGNDAVAGVEIPMPDTKMETKTSTDVVKGGGEVSCTELDDSQLVGALSPIVAKGGEDEPIVAKGDEVESIVADELAPAAYTEMETETDVVESVKVGVGKRKRGGNSKVTARGPTRKIIGDDVCFICFDGGDLVLCDRRGCPKAYHPSCVNRDEAFFRAKGRWNCGWHLCSKCEKNAYYMCYTCTFSLCKGCIKDAVILCVRGQKGFCETCMKTVILIENNEQGNNETKVDFDDKSSWEYLFKDYWIDLKANLSLSSIELANAKNPWKGSDVLTGKHESPDEQVEINNDGGSASDNYSENLKASKSKRRKAKKRLKPLTKEEDSTSAAIAVSGEIFSAPGNTEWASKELLEFVMHMKDGDKSILSQFDVQALLLEYIKRNKLRDLRRKSQINCDARLENLFGKPRVGHFEMLKLIESHFLIKEDSQIDDIQGSVVDTEVNRFDTDGNTEALTKVGKDRKRKSRKKGDWRGPQYNLNDYAAIDIHNINLIYLRRKLMEDLLEDIEKFRDKVVGTFVRIRISGSIQNQDMYRMVQVVGTSKAAEPYKIGKRTTDIMLEILNLNKTEVISIDTISNQEFTEDECVRLRQSIKCGLINRPTVGDVLDKAMEVQAERVNDWLEAEIMRLSHLRDRASETGRRKELRECVEKLQLLKTPEEHCRRLEEIPKIHADPNMDPSHVSEDDDSEMDNNKRESNMRTGGSGIGRRGREPISPGRGEFSSKDSWSGTRKISNQSWELNKNISYKTSSNKGEDATQSFEILNDNLWNQGRSKDTQQSNNLEKPSSATSSETVVWSSHSVVTPESFSVVAPETSLGDLSVPVTETAAKISETEKNWHYQDPSGKVQGPFSLVQLRKWSNNGYFPVDLTIWRTDGKQDDSILLTDALAGRFQKELPPVDNGYPKDSTLHTPHPMSTLPGKTQESSLQQGREGQDGEGLNFDQNCEVQNLHGNLGHSAQSSGGNWISRPDPSSSMGWTTSVEVSKLSTDGVGADYGSRNDLVNLPSPTPKQSTAGWIGGEVGSLMGASSLSDGNGVLQSPAAATPDNGQLARSSTSSSFNPSGSKELSARGSLGVLAPTSLLNSGGQLMKVSENDPPSSHSGFSAVLNSEQGILVGSTNSLQTSHSTVTGETQGVQTHSHLPLAPGSGAHMVSSANNQNPPFETYGWGGAPSQNLEPNSSIHVPGQPLVYGHWGAVPSNVQNPAGNFSTSVISAFPPPDPWRPPITGNQSSMQPPAPPNIPWGMGVAPNNTSVQGLRPDNPNTGWGTVPGNLNMGWGGLAPGNTNMNWGATIQGPSPGNANPGWLVPTGNSGATVQGPPPGIVNPGWVAPTFYPGAIVQGLAPGNANQGWFTPTGNLGANVQGPAPGNGNPGWVAPIGTPGANIQGPVPGNGNPGWVAPTGNPGANVHQGPAPGNGNPGWVAPIGNPGANVQGPSLGNGNPGWVAQTGNPGSNIQGPAAGNASQGWIAPTGNPGTYVQGKSPGNAGQGWVAPTGNPGAYVQGPGPGNASQGWVAPTGDPGANVQGPGPGNASQGWVAPTGNPGACVQGPGPGNASQGWVAPTGNPGANVQGPGPGNENQGWVAPIGNPGANVQGPGPGNASQGWVAHTGNPGANAQGKAPGNANPGWGSPAGSPGMRGSEHHHNGDRFRGRRDRGSQGGDSGFAGGRPRNRQSSLGSGGSRLVCKFNGHCKKGSSCEFLHT